MRAQRRLFATCAIAASVVAVVDGPSAQAATVRVALNGGDDLACGSDVAPCKSLGYVLANRVTPELDTITLAAGEFAMAGTVVSNPDASGDQIVGAGSGPGGTVLRHADNGINELLRFTVPLRVRALAVRLPADAVAARQAIGIGPAGGGSRVEDVQVTVENASSNPVVYSEASDVIFDRLGVFGNLVGDALRVLNATGVVVQDTTLQGGGSGSANALESNHSDVIVRRSRLSREYATNGFDAVLGALNSQLTVESSLITGGRIGVSSQAEPMSSASLELRGVTIDIAAPGVADALLDRDAIFVRTTGPGAGSSTALVERSIFVEPIFAFVEAGSSVRVDCRDAIVPLADTPTIACGASTGNVTAAPAEVFVNALGSDFHLKPGSPAVDGAATATVAGESSTDLEGNPRALDGNADCDVRIDRGAYELTGHAAPVDQCNPSPPPPPPPPPPVDPRPNITKSTFAKAVFRTVGALRGTTLRFSLSEPAAVTLIVERRLSGRRQGRLCVAAGKRNRTRRPCVRYVKVGTVKMVGQAGPNTKRFTGRVGAKVLAPGRYRARLLATDLVGQRSLERRLTFRVFR